MILRMIAMAYAKLLFPQVKSLEDLTEEDVSNFKGLYQEYCLNPAVYRRGIIRQQCHLIDKEVRKEMPEFKIKDTVLMHKINVSICLCNLFTWFADWSWCMPVIEEG